MMTIGLLFLVLSFIDIPEIQAGNEPDSSFLTSHEQQDPDLLAAIFAAIDEAEGSWQVFDFQIDHIQTQEDGRKAIVWLAACDPESGMVLGREPDLALAVLDETDQWQVYLSGETGFQREFDSFQFASQSVLDDAMLAGEKTGRDAVVYGGYYLPWAATLEKRLTWSVSHTSCNPIYYCTHAFDFADGTMFPLLAAKGGTVYHWKDTCANGDPYCTNSITIEDRSTTPWTYQIYIHMAYDSIPDALKQVGTPVMRGQFIGNVDDTGASTAHHLHFMVVTEDTMYQSGNGYIWGIAEDITFRDVSINWDEATQGGRPRLAYEAADYGGEGQTYYISGNVPANPPTGGLTQPADKQLITDPLLTVSGWGDDDVGVTNMEILASVDDRWFVIGEGQQDNPFTTQIDLCETDIPDGPFRLGLRVWDAEGNPSMPLDIRHMVKDTPCDNVDVPTCTPSDNQVAIFSGPNYSGVCTLLGLGAYPDASALAPVGENQIVSIKLGINVQIILFSEPQYEGRLETFTDNDRYLVDNQVGAGAVSSAIVRSRNTHPELPELDPVLGADGSPPTSLDSLILTWRGEGATKFYAELYNGSLSGDLLDLRYWSKDSFWSIGSLPPGTYAWRVRGRIAVPRGSTYDTYYSDWASGTFSVISDSFPSGGTLPVPFYEVFDFGQGDWHDSGPWQVLSARTGGLMWGTGDGSLYADQGGLTSPVIDPGSAGALFLRFDYLYGTEVDSRFWDQRLLQVSVDNGPFKDLTQFFGETPQKTLTSHYVDLSTFTGAPFRLRWFFSPGDDLANSGQGWVIDNVRVGFTGPPQDVDDDDSFSTARVLTDDMTLGGAIDHPGDVDFYKFEATAGDFVLLNVDAQSLSPSSPLDTVLTLYPGQDDRPPILENNDEGSGTTDSALVYRIPETGWYYARVRANGHPGTGGSSFTYTIALDFAPGEDDVTEPTVTLITPDGLGGLPNQGWIWAEASDDPLGSGVYQVAFWFHDRTWTDDSSWVHLGTDSYAGDGWGVPFDTDGLPEGGDYAVLALAADLSGNVGADVHWNARVDRTPPQLTLLPLQNPSPSNILNLQWTAGDSASGIAYFALHININNTGWQMLNGNIPAASRQYVYQALDAQFLAFRLTAYDRSGNAVSAETYTTTPGYPLNYYIPLISN
jgi:hypothetical protein